jgi:hypothetical protein
MQPALAECVDLEMCSARISTHSDMDAGPGIEARGDEQSGGNSRIEDVYHDMARFEVATCIMIAIEP